MRTLHFDRVQDWQVHTGVNVTTLAKMVGVDRTHLTRVLSGSRQCSLAVALRLQRVTGVPVENLVQAPRLASDAQRGKVA